MSDQPTRTTERTLAMLRDWVDPEVTAASFRSKHGPISLSGAVRAAIAALESAAAEIATEKARADTAEKEAEGLMLHVERAEKEIERLRAEPTAKQSHAAELDTVTKQRDALVRIAKDAHAYMIQNGLADESDEVMAAIEAAEQPKPQGVPAMSPREEAIERVRKCADNVQDPSVWDVEKLLAAYDEAVAALAKVTAQRDELVKAATDYRFYYQRNGRYTAEVLDEVLSKIAAEQPPAEKARDSDGFYDQLPKGPTHGRFTVSERAELDDLKRKAFASAKPPAEKAEGGA